jgi:hypothetical protein
MPIFRHRIVFKPGEVEPEDSERRIAEIIDNIIRKVL